MRILPVVLSLAVLYQGCSALGVRGGARKLPQASQTHTISMGQSVKYVCSNKFSQGNGCLYNSADFQTDYADFTSGSLYGCTNQVCRLKCSITCAVSNVPTPAGNPGGGVGGASTGSGAGVPPANVAVTVTVNGKQPAKGSTSNQAGGATVGGAAGGPVSQPDLSGRPSWASGTSP